MVVHQAATDDDFVPRHHKDRKIYGIRDYETITLQEGERNRRVKNVEVCAKCVNLTDDLFGSASCFLSPMINKFQAWKGCLLRGFTYSIVRECAVVGSLATEQSLNTYPFYGNLGRSSSPASARST